MQDGTKNTNHPTSEFELLLFRIRINMLKSFTKKKKSSFSNKWNLHVCPICICAYVLFIFVSTHISLCIVCISFIFCTCVCVVQLSIHELERWSTCVCIFCVYCNIWVYTYTVIYGSTCTHPCVLLHTYLCVCHCMHGHLYAHVQMQTCIFMKICIHVCLTLFMPSVHG